MYLLWDKAEILGFSNQQTNTLNFQRKWSFYRWDTIPPGNLSLKSVLVGCFSGFEPRCVRIALTDDHCYVGAVTSAEGTWSVKVDSTHYELYPGIYLSTEEMTENLSWFNRIRGWSAEYRAPSLATSWPQSTLGRQKCLRSCRTKLAFQHQITLNLNPQSVLWSTQRRMESPNLR